MLFRYLPDGSICTSGPTSFPAARVGATACAASLGDPDVAIPVELGAGR